MKEVTEKYYMSTDGGKFKDESECREYEEASQKIKNIKTQINALNKELACAEYVLYGKGKYIKSVDYVGGCGHDGYYHKCPHCGQLVGGYERQNTSLKVAENTYKCEKCGKFFRYS